jgi:hypothetical protein
MRRMHNSFAARLHRLSAARTLDWPSRVFSLSQTTALHVQTPQTAHSLGIRADKQGSSSESTFARPREELRSRIKRDGSVR